MKFVADVNVTRRIINRLRAEGHEVVSIAEIDSTLSDRSILRLALDQKALVLTFDKDYRYLTIEERQASLGVVWVRLARLRGEAETERVVQVIREQDEQLWNRLTIIYPGSIAFEELVPREYRKGYIAGQSAFFENLHRLTTEYGLSQEEALEVLDAWAETKLKDWAEGKGPDTHTPPEIEIPEQYRNRRREET